MVLYGKTASEVRRTERFSAERSDLHVGKFGLFGADVTESAQNGFGLVLFVTAGPAPDAQKGGFERRTAWSAPPETASGRTGKFAEWQKGAERDLFGLGWPVTARSRTKSGGGAGAIPG